MTETAVMGKLEALTERTDEFRRWYSRKCRTIRQKRSWVYSISSTYCALGPGTRSNVTLLLVDLFNEKFSGFRSMDSTVEISREISFWHCRTQLLYLKIIHSDINSFAVFITSFFKWPALVWKVIQAFWENFIFVSHSNWQKMEAKSKQNKKIMRFIRPWVAPKWVPKAVSVPSTKGWFQLFRTLRRL